MKTAVGFVGVNEYHHREAAVCTNNSNNFSRTIQQFVLRGDQKAGGGKDNSSVSMVRSSTLTRKARRPYACRGRCAGDFVYHAWMMDGMEAIQ